MLICRCKHTIMMRVMFPHLCPTLLVRKGIKWNTYSFQQV